MIVWLYVDQFASMLTTVEEEYEGLERLFRESLDCALVFHRDKYPHELRNGCPDIYLFDIGGLCYVDHSGDRRHDFCHEVVRAVEEHPNTLFIPWTSMTRDMFRFALTEVLPEFTAVPEDDRVYGGPPRRNIWCPKRLNDPSYDIETLEKQVIAHVGEFFKHALLPTN